METSGAKPKKLLPKVLFVLWCIVMLALIAGYIYLRANDRQLFLFGVIWRDSALCLLFPLVQFCYILLFFTEAANRKKRAKCIAVIVLFVVMLAAVILSFLDNISSGKRDVTAEIPLDGSSILLIESEEKIAGMDVTFNEITVYKRTGITVAKLETIDEDMYINNSMVAEKQFTYEISGEKIKLMFDYGGLADGYSWKTEEIKNDPPKHIIKEYTI